MARDSSYGDNSSLPPIPVTPQSYIPRRATRELPAIHDDELETEEIPVRRTGGLPATHYYDEEHPLTRHRIWLNPMLICLVVIVVYRFWRSHQRNPLEHLDYRHTWIPF